MLEQQRDTFRTQPLDLQEFERRRRELQQQLIALVATPLGFDLLENSRQTFADPGDIRDFALRIREDPGNALRITFDRGSAVAVTADAKAVFARDFHQVGGFVENLRKFTIFQPSSLLVWV